MCQGCGWQGWQEDLEELVEDDRYAWALDTLTGILERVQDEKCITEKMKRAVENIKVAVER